MNINGTQQVPVSIMDAKSPPLLGVDLLNKMEAEIRFGENPYIIFHAKNQDVIPLRRLASGHAALKVVPGAPEPEDPNAAAAAALSISP